jgi:hypothetical protein
MKIVLAILAAALAATPALADDRIVPANAAGPLADVTGRAWFRVLGHCAALYLERAELLKDKDAAAAKGLRDQAASFLGDAATRLERDRGLGNDDAFKTSMKQIQAERIFVGGTGAANDDAFPKQDSNCAAILKAAEAIKD